MKRITFLLVSLLTILTGFSQQQWPNSPATPTKFRHLKIDSLILIPTGETPSLNNAQNLETRAGALFLVVTSTDTLLKLWTGERWIDVGGSQQTNNLPNELIFGGSVTPLGGYDFHVQEATFRIDNVVYQSDAVDITISASDGSLSRIDRIFLMANTSPPPSGIASVLEGELAVNPLEPQIDGDQIGLAFISIPVGATEPTLTSTFVYNENTGESTVTNTGTTTDPNNTTNVNTTYGGTKSLNVTNINNNDQVFLTKPTGIWSVLGFDGLSFFIKLKAVMPGAGNLRVQLFVGTVAVSSEVLIPLNKSNITTYQPITIPAGTFGNITNTSITRVRVRYTRPGNSTNFSGFYLDDMFFVSGISQPSTSVTLTLIPPVGFQNSPGNTINNNGTWTISPVGGSAGQYYSITGWTNFPAFVQSLGALDGRARAAEGATIDGSELFLQTVDATESGLATPDMFTRVYTRYYIQNGGDGDTLAYPVNDSVTGIKSITTDPPGIITATDTTLHFDFTGLGGSGQRFGATGEDEGPGARNFGGSLALQGSAGDIGFWSQHDNVTAGYFASIQNNTQPVVWMIKESDDATSIAPVLDIGTWTAFTPVDGSGGALRMWLRSGSDTAIANEMQWIWTDHTNGSEDSKIVFRGMDNGVLVDFLTIDATGVVGGGGGGTGSNLSYDAANHEVDIDGGGTSATIPLALDDGATEGLASFAAADFTATAGNIVIDYTNGQAASGSVKGFLTSADWTTFNSKVGTTRTINTTSPITGGGDLSADRTIAINNAAADGSTKGAASFTAADFDATTGNISLDYTNGQAASGSLKGFLASADWTTFNNKATASVTKGFMTDLLTVNSVNTIIPRFIWYDEFQGSNTNAIGSAFTFELATGTGANGSSVVGAGSISGATGYGYAELNTGTTNSGRIMLSGGHGATNANDMGKVDNDYYYRCEFKNVIINDLSDGTETYKVFFGFQVDNSVSNAIYFTYTHSENSGVWNCTSHNSTTPETTSTGTTVAADTEYDLAIEYYNQTAKFYLNGSLVATHTTQVPPAAGLMKAPAAKVLKSAGTTARIVYMDAMGLRITHENDL